MNREIVFRTTLSGRTERKKGFTLVEVLVATAIMLIVLIVLLQAIAGMTSIWHNSAGNVSSFESARSAFTTLNRVLSRATLKTYIDYVDSSNPPFGAFRTSSSGTFVPANFARASELHFVSGPAASLLQSTTATAATNPGDGIFFQAPLGIVSTSTDKYLQKALNSVGFFVQYGDIDYSIFPSFLGFNATSHRYRYRLIQYVQPTEAFSVYNFTSLSPSNYANGTNSLPSWLPANQLILDNAATKAGYTVMAENVVLLLVRPRLDPQNESDDSTALLGAAYSPTNQNSVLCPDYNYDSRAWMSTYPAGARVMSTSNGVPVKHALYMRNQLPPIVDVAMVCVDSTSLAQFNNTATATPPTAIQIPVAAWSAGAGPSGGTPFSHSADLDYDLNQYGAQLTAAHLRFHVFRSSVQMQAAAWANQ